MNYHVMLNPYAVALRLKNGEMSGEFRKCLDGAGYCLDATSFIPCGGSMQIELHWYGQMYLPRNDQ